MKTVWLQDALSVLESNRGSTYECESVTFHISPDAKFIRLSANAELDAWNTESSERSDTFLEFHAETEVQFSYRHLHLALYEKRRWKCRNMFRRERIPLGILGCCGDSVKYSVYSICLKLDESCSPFG
ncbi:unnamed protein product [Umbelopsis ramanniana]